MMEEPDWVLLNVSDWAVSVVIGPYLLGSFALFGSAVLLLRFRKYGWGLGIRHPDVISADLSIGGIGKVTVKPNYENVRIAYHAWVELSTRKAVIPFDEQHDVIVDVYDSWYVLFKHLRELAKSIPAQKLRKCKETQNLVDLMMRVLNEGMRPHLTQWQAKFRLWYERELKKTEDCHCPQEIQRRYPEYDVLVDDLRRVNAGMIEYAAMLRRVAYGEPYACEVKDDTGS